MKPDPDDMVRIATAKDGEIVLVSSGTVEFFTTTGIITDQPTAVCIRIRSTEHDHPPCGAD